MNILNIVLKKIIDSLNNDFEDNWNEWRFGPESKDSYVGCIQRPLEQKYTDYISKKDLMEIFRHLIRRYGNYLMQIQETHDLLFDDQSKNIYVDLLAFRIVGHRKIKLSTNNAKRVFAMEAIRSTIDYSKTLPSNFQNRPLLLHNFKYHEKEVNIYVPEYSTLNAFYLQQYKCFADNSITISPHKGDTIIDCGGCWGDTTLEFAVSSGDNGKVYVYEFIPFNLKILNLNIDINPHLKKRVEVIDRAVWEKSDLEVFYQDNGPCSRVQFNTFDDQEGKTSTLSIDDLVQTRNLSTVDFIKMDIEGAELPALRGAIKTLKEHKPKLAISIYHSVGDFANIAPWLDSLNLGYKFFVRHFTIFHDETVLFALAD